MVSHLNKTDGNFNYDSLSFLVFLDYPHKGSVMLSFEGYITVSLNKLSETH